MMITATLIGLAIGILVGYSIKKKSSGLVFQHSGFQSYCSPCMEKRLKKGKKHG